MCLVPFGKYWIFWSYLSTYKIRKVGHGFGWYLAMRLGVSPRGAGQCSFLIWRLNNMQGFLWNLVNWDNLNTLENLGILLLSCKFNISLWVLVVPPSPIISKENHSICTCEHGLLDANKGKKRHPCWLLAAVLLGGVERINSVAANLKTSSFFCMHTHWGWAQASSQQQQMPGDTAH